MYLYTYFDSISFFVVTEGLFLISELCKVNQCNIFNLIRWETCMSILQEQGVLVNISKLNLVKR